MISENYQTNQSIVDAIIWFHRNGGLPHPTPAGMVLNGGLLEIDYGYNGHRYGTIGMTRGQFAVTRVSDATGTLMPLLKYNHNGENKTLQDYIDALKNNDLNKDQKHASALIILTAESCRSQMVNSAMSGILDSGKAFSNHVWNGLLFAFKNYQSTARFLGYGIHAGEVPWSWLRSEDYIAYIESTVFTENAAYISKVAEYNQENAK